MALAVQTKTERVIEAIDPATLEVIGEVKVATPSECQAIVAKAREALNKWRRLSLSTRVRYMEKLKEEIRSQSETLCEWISKDNGKPLLEAYSSEVYLSMEYIQFYARKAFEILSPKTIPTPQLSFKGKVNTLVFEPQGVILIISPWNFPFSIPVTQIVTALLAGNVVVLKPSEMTVMVARRIEELIRNIDLPEGVFQVAYGDGRVGETLLDLDVDKVIFTGSVATGRKVYEKCATRLRGCVLELGGKDPMLVLEDADLDLTSSAAVWGAFTNAGQCCASVERVYVPKRLYRKFLDLVVEKTKKLRLGHGLEDHVDLGPLISERQRNVVKEHVQDAREKGAKILTGGKPWNGLPGYFFEPTVLADVNHEMKCMREETFGPTMPVMAYKNVSEAIDLCNDSHYGLTASIWTKERKVGRSLAKRLEFGTVTINDMEFSYAIPQCPWGGVKESGLGHTHSEFGFYEVVHPKVISEDKGLIKKKPYWYPYHRSAYQLMKGAGNLFFSRGLIKKLSL